jgi:hypothetical protein
MEKEEKYIMDNWSKIELVGSEINIDLEYVIIINVIIFITSLRY